MNSLTFNSLTIDNRFNKFYVKWHGAQYAKWLSIGHSGPNAERVYVSANCNFINLNFN